MIRTIYIYLYRFNGEPRYVGQTPNVEKRDKDHIVSKRKTSFEKFLAKFGRENLTMEVVAEVDDFVRGPKANRLENEMMDKYETFRPGEFGFNQARSQFENTIKRDVARRAAIKAARSQQIFTDETRRKIGDALRGKKRSPEVIRAASAWGRTSEGRAEMSKKMKERAALGLHPRGYKHKTPRSSEHRLSISLRRKGIRMSEEQKRVISNTLKGRPRCLELSRFYEVKDGFEFFDCWESQHLLAPAA